MRQGRAKYVFPGSNTPQGFYSFYRDGLSGLDRVFILKGGPGTGKSTLMRKIGIAMLERGYDVEFWQCSSDNDSLDGVIIPVLSVGVIDGTAPHNIDPLYPGAIDEIINLGEHWNDQYLRHHKQEIIEINTEISACFETCYSKLSEAGDLMVKLQQNNNTLIDERKMATAQMTLVEGIFLHQSLPVRHLFSSTVTPRGFISFTDAISRTANVRYMLTGTIGCGKERLIAAIAALSEEKGHNIEIYHNTFMPQQIEMILLPSLGVSVVDCGAEPKDVRAQDIVINCDDLIVDGGVFAEDAEAWQEKFDSLVAEAASAIADAKSLHDNLECFYNKAMDFEAVDLTGSRLFNKILSLAATKEK